MILLGLPRGSDSGTFKELAVFRFHLDAIGIRATRARYQDDKNSGLRQRVPVATKRLAQKTLGAIPAHCIADTTARNDTDANRIIARGKDVQNKKTPGVGIAVAKDPVVLR